MTDTEDYLGETFDSINDIPQEVVDDDELAVVNLGTDRGHRVISREQYEP